MSDSIAPLSNPRVALVGFGEAGEAFARAEGWRGLTFAWDILPERRAAIDDTPEYQRFRSAGS